MAKVVNTATNTYVRLLRHYATANPILDDESFRLILESAQPVNPVLKDKPVAVVYAASKAFDKVLEQSGRLEWTKIQKWAKSLSTGIFGKPARDAGKRIEQARRRKAKILNLSALGLQFVPAGVFELLELEELELGDNRLRRIPAGIGQLKHLKRIGLTGNPLQNIHDVPGLILDWNSFLRCQAHISLDNVVGISIRTGNYQGTEKEVKEPSKLVRQLSRLRNLRELFVGLDAIPFGSLWGW